MSRPSERRAEGLTGKVDLHRERKHSPVMLYQWLDRSIVDNIEACAYSPYSHRISPRNGFSSPETRRSYFDREGNQWRNN